MGGVVDPVDARDEAAAVEHYRSGALLYARYRKMWGTKYPVRVYFEHFLMLQVCRVFTLLAWVDSLGCTAVLLRRIRMWGKRGPRKGAANTAHEDV